MGAIIVTAIFCGIFAGMAICLFVEYVKKKNMNVAVIKSMKPYADRKRTQRKKNSTAIKDN